EALGEERADRAIDHASRKRGPEGRTAFAARKAAGDFAGGVELFSELDGEREEVGAGARVLRTARGQENAGVAVAHEDGAIGLFGHFAGFDREGFATHLARYTMNIH